MVTAIGKNIETFRRHYPEGKNYVVAHDVDTPFTRNYAGITLTFVNTHHLIKKLVKDL